MQDIFYKVRTLFIVLTLFLVILKNIRCQDNFIKGKPKILFKSPSEDNMVLKETTVDNENDNLPSNIDENEETTEPFIFTTSIPSVSPHPPGIALVVDNEIQTTTLDNILANSITTNSIQFPTTKDDFNLDDDEIIENNKTNINDNSLNNNNQKSLLQSVDNIKSEGVNSFENSEINDQYVFSVSNENYVSTTVSNKLEDNFVLNNFDESEVISNDLITSTTSPFMVTEDFLVTTETNFINTTSTIPDVSFNNTDMNVSNEYNTLMMESNYTKEIKKSCPEIEICNPGCGISIDTEGCQRCTCLWIPKFCIETSECNGPEYICEYGKCLCNNNYTQDMDRSGFCIPKPNNLKQNEI